ncbi:MAG: flippase-like domain-containing protein [Gomphosphaeria aponina SAG 52.96 = DSM 107014]|uniref:Flippase-like domain-containing protein n=1 Tax=Gomphosphaeria aponina SAG 52.96 = DSM 107014 TaxID=1521640 RepID=A0A941GRY1_9CHRO|nr:flippase-like domain-containing protein [Gomphosphaeria aponina SAG 52.96 = DSM 107014]
MKNYLRWLILGGTLFFLLAAFKDHWREVVAVRIEPQGWLMLFFALLSTFAAHIWSAWVWTWILKAFHQPFGGATAIKIYLITNLAKYLPGNIWHFYGRISAVTKAGGSLEVASLSVLLEPLLMAAAALLIALTSSSFGWLTTSQVGLQFLVLAIVLLGINPHILNWGIRLLSRLKGQKTATMEIKQYPLLPLLGELCFLLLRGTGFLFAVAALMPVNYYDIPQLLSVFSFAWLLGLIVPGAPGGLGVFEATAIASLDSELFPPALVLTVVAFFRVVSLLAEASTAGLAYLMKEQNFIPKN